MWWRRGEPTIAGRAIGDRIADGDTVLLPGQSSRWTDLLARQVPRIPPSGGGLRPPPPARPALIRERPPMTGVTTHIAIRPGWVCGGCGVEWPCRTRRRQLLAEFDGAKVSLSLLMSSYFVDASEDLPDAPAGDLHMRFFGWTRQPSHRTGG
jgi:hypothetical protein